MESPCDPMESPSNSVPPPEAPPEALISFRVAAKLPSRKEIRSRGEHGGRTYSVSGMQTPKPVKVPMRVWGPSAWRTIHSFALAYDGGGGGEGDDKKAAQMRRFLESMAVVLPCAECSAEFGLLLKELDGSLGEALASRGLFAWTVKLHDRVSERVRDKKKKGGEKNAEVVMEATSEEKALADLMVPAPHDAPPSLVGPNALALALAVGILVALLVSTATVGAFALLRSLFISGMSASPSIASIK